MISGLVNKQGVIVNHKQSLSFLITNNTLMLQSGAALASNGTYIDLVEPSYTLYENISFDLLKHKEHYYFYLHKGRLLKDDANAYTFHTQIDQGLHFIISEEHIDTMILLGEIDIDHDTKDEGISVARNSCEPQPNEIDISQRDSISLQDRIINNDERHWFSEPLFDLVQAIHNKMKQEQCWELSTLSSAFFSFYETINTSNLSYEKLYSKCKYNTKLFKCTTASLWTEETKKHIKLLETQVFKEAHTFSCNLYAIDKDKEDGFFHCYIKHIKNLIKSLELDIKLESTNKETKKETKKLIDLSKDISKTDNYEFEAVLPSFFMLEDENEDVQAYNPPIDNKPSQDEHEDTVLVAGNSTKQSIQIGRSASSGNDIILGKDDISISRVHAKITVHEQGFFLEDLSSQGTYVDGIRIEKNKKKFVTVNNNIVFGKNGHTFDLTQNKIQELLS